LSVAREIYSACEESVQHSFESLRSTGELDPKPLTVAVGSMTRSIERNPDAMMLLYRIKQKGGAAFNRAVDASIHMITFGRFLQFAPERLELLGIAGLLLDVGMLKVPDEILRKKNSLTEEEYERTKSHVMHSVEIVRASPGLPKGVAEIVLQHHERLDGSGYPRGLSNRQISIDGAIAGLVDSYSALTSKRSFAEQESPSNALSKFYKLRGKLFHEALVEQFIQCLGIYPVGSMVELNSGEIAIVISQNLVRRLQPRVMVVFDRALHPIWPQVVLDLTKEPKANKDEPYRILRTLPRDKLPIDPKQFFLEIAD
jgi:HD-GYP domain-containing protein (c-di-GMP phosphodiesterase class II)